MGKVWPMVHAERAALIRDLGRLDDQQWQELSLCDQWTVHDVVAHLVDTARTTRLSFLTSWPGRGSTSIGRTRAAYSVSAVMVRRRRCNGSVTWHRG